MSKNAEGWIRHRGGECPVGEGVKVDYRMRDGDVDDFGSDAVRLKWNHIGGCADIMAYRLHKPAEQVEPFLEAVQAFNALAKVPQLDGPIGWRDRITELDEERKTIDALYQVNTARIETERADLVQKLASEGFALIGRINDLLTDAAQKHEDMSDWRNWKEGDRIEVISKGFDGRDIGEMLTVDGLDNDDANQPVGVMGDDKTHSWPIVSRCHFLCIKWHSRPSA